MARHSWTRLSYWYPATSTGVGAFGFNDVFQNTIDITPFVNQYAGQIDSLWNNTPGSKCFVMPAYVPTTFVQFPSSTLKDAVSNHPETHGYLRAIPLPAIWKDSLSTQYEASRMRRHTAKLRSRRRKCERNRQRQKCPHAARQFQRRRAGRKDQNTGEPEPETIA